MKFFLLLCLPLTLSAMPWGKDADLAYIKPRKALCPPQAPKPQNLAVQTAEKLIWFHQNVISRSDGPRSHYVPSSSQYTLEAIQKYGFLKGYLMGCDRLMRENNDPWIYPNIEGPYGTLKYDPVR